MSPGDISSLSLSDAVAFRVNFRGDAPPPQDRYWRGLVLGDFNGRTWTGNEPSVGSNSRLEVDYRGTPVHYQITMEPTRQHWVFALDIPYSWDLQQTHMGRQQQLARMMPIDQRISYNAVSHTDYRVNVRLSDWAKRNYTQLPERRNPRTRALALEMRQQAGSDEVFINRVLRKFNAEQFFYTLQPPPLGNNPVDRFLFETRQGFCEHYASAFAVLMRAAGIPARIVLGYQGGEINPLGNYMIVRQADAHAWTEVWLPGRGWYRVDPTAAVAPERIDAGRSGAMFDGIGASWGLTAPSEILYQLQLTWDALNAGWNEWVLGYGPENQNLFLQSLGMNKPTWRKMMLTLIAVTVALIAIVSFLLMLRYLPPRKDPAAILYRKFTRATGVSPGRGETPLAYSNRVARQKADIAAAASDITEQYLNARYGPPQVLALEKLRESVSRFAAQR
jgi:transglutaminase-like putative cysteine protease